MVLYRITVVFDWDVGPMAMYDTVEVDDSTAMDCSRVPAYLYLQRHEYRYGEALMISNHVPSSLYPLNGCNTFTFKGCLIQASTYEPEIRWRMVVRVQDTTVLRVATRDSQDVGRVAWLHVLDQTRGRLLGN